MRNSLSKLTLDCVYIIIINISIFHLLFSFPNLYFKKSFISRYSYFNFLFTCTMYMKNKMQKIIIYNTDKKSIKEKKIIKNQSSYTGNRKTILFRLIFNPITLNASCKIWLRVLQLHHQQKHVL